MVRFVFLDMDDTVMDFHASERDALSRALREYDIDPTDATLARYSEINRAQWRRLERGELTHGEVMSERFRLLLAELGREADPAEMSELYEGYLAQTAYLMPHAAEVLPLLSAKYEVYAVSNGTVSVQLGRMERTGIGGYFRDRFFSQQVGYSKPRSEFFDICFGRIPGFSAEDSVIVGDSLSSDILGGINAGIRTVWLCPGERENGSGIVPDRVISSLAELPGLLETM